MGHEAITEFAASVTMADLEADPYPIYARLRRDAIGTQTRQAVADTELGGITIPGGAPVGSLVSSANRDEAKFTDPDRFDIFRYRPGSPGAAPAPRTANLAFGAERHFCAGHAFSRAQVRIAIETLIRRFPRLAADPARPPEFRGWEFRAPRRLDVLLSGPGR